MIWINLRIKKRILEVKVKVQKSTLKLVQAMYLKFKVKNNNLSKQKKEDTLKKLQLLKGKNCLKVKIWKLKMKMMKMNLSIIFKDGHSKRKLILNELFLQNQEIGSTFKLA